MPLIPRVQNVPAGGTRYFLNGTTEQFWPGTITSDGELEVCKLDNSTKYAVCPSSGFESLRSTFGAFKYTTQADFPSSGLVISNLLKATKDAVTGSTLWFNFPIQSPLSLMPATCSSLQVRGVRDETVVIQPHAATTVTQGQLTHAWTDVVGDSWGGSDPSLSEYKYASKYISSVSTLSPWVRVMCSSALNLSAEAEQA